MSEKIKLVKDVVKSYKSTRKTFWFIVQLIQWILFIPELAMAILACLIRIIIVLLLPERKANRLNIWVSALHYQIKEFYLDIMKRNYSIGLAWERLLRGMEIHTLGRETDKCYGENNPDKTFFVIRPFYYGKRQNALAKTPPHLFTNYYHAIQLYGYALEKKYIPVVDWENYHLPHQEDNEVNGTHNAWEYFWEQPGGYDLKEVYQSKHVILSSQNVPNGDILPPARTPNSKIRKYAETIIRKGAPLAMQIPFNEATRKYVEEAKNRLFIPNKKILGVAIRGTSYARMQVGHHASQPLINEYIGLIRRRKAEWGADYIFFTNEESETVDIMKRAFGEELIVLDRKRYVNYHIYSDNGENPTNEDINPLYAPGQRYQTNLDYLTEMYLLSCCDFLLTAMSGGIRAVLMWNGGRYENMEIIDKGVYAEAWEK